MSLKTAIHIGFPKTGTTTLQKHLFNSHSQVHYLGKSYENQHIHNLILDLVMTESTAYDPEELRKYIAGHMEKGIRDGKKVLVLSDELLVSASKVRDKGVVAQRLHQLFPGASVIVTLRNQYEMLKSAYINGGRLLKNLPERFKGLAITFEEWLEMSYEKPERSYIGNIRYLDTLDYYTGLFGKDNVCVVLFEEFLTRKESYTGTISRFLGIDEDESNRLLAEKHENKRLQQSQMDFELASSRLGASGKNPVVSGIFKRLFNLGRGFKKDRSASAEFPSGWKERLLDYYRQDNAGVVAKYRLPLEEYGYPL